MGGCTFGAWDAVGWRGRVFEGLMMFRLFAGGKIGLAAGCRRHGLLHQLHHEVFAFEGVADFD